MEKIKIFDDVVSIMKNDASFCNDKSVDDAKYRAQITEDMTNKDFLFVMKKYIGSFHLPGHLAFYEIEDETSLPFDVRRYQNALYVTKAHEMAPVKVGEKIIGVDGKTIAQIAEENEELLYGEAEERQGLYWKGLLRFFKEIQVEDANGQQRTEAIKLFEVKDASEKYLFNMLNEDTCYLKLEDFEDEESIHALIVESDAQIVKCKNMIIDVRVNNGGDNTAYYPLYKYCLPEGKKALEVDNQTYGAEINYSERNVNCRLEMLKPYEQQELPEETRQVLEMLKNELIQNKGKGFCYLPEEDIEISEIGVAEPEKVIILADCYCGSSGDAFVQTMKCSPKVTVVGRPTMGIQDYSDVAFADYGKYQLIYPTSRSLAVKDGKGMSQIGVGVDVYVPWTPEHIERDIDLEKALELL